MSMNVSLLYELVSTIVNRTSLEIRNRRVLRDFVLAVLASRSCLLDDVAHALRPRGAVMSQYRRLQRFLANERIEMSSIQHEWATIVLEHMKPEHIVLMVDETALSQHLKIMVLGIWTADGCVPVAWRSYRSTEYPDCGQVALITDLVQRIRPILPFPCPTILLADRGIGTSPDLITNITQLGIDILFRVQGSTRFHNAEGKDVSLKELGIAGFVWQAGGEVFKKAGWLSLYATVAWDVNYDDPWCLVSSIAVDPQLYGLRFDQEVSFRDLKSDGFQWHRSHVWMPDHADRLLLVLAIAYWLVICSGQAVPPVTRGRQARHSTFRRGLDAITAQFRPTIASVLPPPPLPPPKITSVVQ
jgi:hypothetical protein